MFRKLILYCLLVLFLPLSKLKAQTTDRWDDRLSQQGFEGIGGQSDGVLICGDTLVFTGLFTSAFGIQARGIVGYDNLTQTPFELPGDPFPGAFNLFQIPEQKERRIYRMVVPEDEIQDPVLVGQLWYLDIHEQKWYFEGTTFHFLNDSTKQYNFLLQGLIVEPDYFFAAGSFIAVDGQPISYRVRKDRSNGALSDIPYFIADPNDCANQFNIPPTNIIREKQFCIIAYNYYDCPQPRFYYWLPTDSLSEAKPIIMPNTDSVRIRGKFKYWDVCNCFVALMEAKYPTYHYLLLKYEEAEARWDTLKTLEELSYWSDKINVTLDNVNETLYLARSHYSLDENNAILYSDLYRFQQADTTLELAVDSIYGSIRAVARGDSGDYFLIGILNKIHNVLFNSVAVCQSDSCWPLGTGVSSTNVKRMKIIDGEVFVMGDFKTAFGLYSPRMVRWQPDSATFSAIPVGFTRGDPLTAETRNDTLYAGGYFETIGGKPINRIGRWDPATQTWQNMGGTGSFGNPFADKVDEIVRIGDTVYYIRSRAVWAFDERTQKNKQLLAPYMGEVTQILNVEGRLIIAGDFKGIYFANETPWSETRMGGLAAYDPSTQKIAQLGDSVKSKDCVRRINQLLWQPPYIYCLLRDSAVFYQCSDSTQAAFTRINALTGQWEYLPGVFAFTNDYLYNTDISQPFAVNDRYLYVLSKYMRIDGQYRRLLRYDLINQTICDFDIPANDTIISVAAQKREAYFGGYFTTIADTVPSFQLARLIEGETPCMGIHRPFIPYQLPTSTSVEDNEKLSADQALFKIYPNPSSGQFTIETPAPVEKISVFDIVGKLALNETDFVFDADNRRYENQTAKLNPGVYCVVLSGAGRYYSSKLVVK